MFSVSVLHHLAVRLLLFAVLLERVASQPPPPSSSATTRVLYVPLDERYATRGLWLNLVPIAGEVYDGVTPPLAMLSARKIPGNLTLLHAWVEDNAASALAQHRADAARLGNGKTCACPGQDEERNEGHDA